MRRLSWPKGATPPRTGSAEARRRSAGRLRLLTGALSIAGHLGILLALISAHGESPAAPPPEPVPVELVDMFPAPVLVTPPAPAPPSPAKPAPPTKTAPTPKKSAPARIIARATPARAHADPLPAGDDGPEDQVAEVSDAQLAGAATAGSGPPGRPCDMTRRLQAALRRDARVQAAVADARNAPGATGKAILVWNGDWIRSHGQDGNGLAAVREAIMWEVGFAPGVCRAEPVHGLILISLSDTPGAARLVVGQNQWRWSDLLGARPRGLGDTLTR